MLEIGVPQKPCYMYIYFIHSKYLNLHMEFDFYFSVVNYSIYFQFLKFPYLMTKVFHEVIIHSHHSCLAMIPNS